MRTSAPSLTATRTLSAVALLLIGGIHYQQYRYAFYSVIPTIGSLFIANFVAATALGLFLLAPVGEQARTCREAARPAGRAGRRRRRSGRPRRAADQRAHAPVRLHGTRLPVRDRAHDHIRGPSNLNAHAVPDPRPHDASSVSPTQQGWLTSTRRATSARPLSEALRSLPRSAPEGRCRPGRTRGWSFGVVTPGLVLAGG